MQVPQGPAWEPQGLSLAAVASLLKRCAGHPDWYFSGTFGNVLRVTCDTFFLRHFTPHALKTGFGAWLVCEKSSVYCLSEVCCS